jgi:hypothetical protein
MLLKYFTLTNVTSLFSIGAFLSAAVVFYDSYSTMSWTKTQGEIYTVNGQTFGVNQGAKSSPMTVNIKSATYTYVVDDWYYYGDAAINRNQDINKPITVYFNPNDPNQSTLHIGINWPYTLMLCFIGFILGYAAILWRDPNKSLNSDAEKRRAR